LTDVTRLNFFDVRSSASLFLNTLAQNTKQVLRIMARAGLVN